MAFTLSSSAFIDNSSIPAQYTCDGHDISPPLSWKDIPVGTQSFVLFLDDPDAPAGVWDHWVLYNIPPNVAGLPENVKDLPAGTQVGKNSWQKASYGGPCPPDREHRYSFRLYALDTVLNLGNGMTKAKVEKAMQNHVLGSTELMGRYNRKR